MVVSGTSTTARTAVLVDPHPLWLDAVEEVVARVQFEVIGKTTSFDEALCLVQELDPALVIGEVAGGGGDTAGSRVASLRECSPSLEVIVLSLVDDEAAINAALSAGALAYVLKTAHPDDLAAVVRQVAEHSIYLQGSRLATVSRPPHAIGEVEQLTQRELEILRLVAEGHSNSQLAKMLWVTEQTVKFHLSNIYRKLNVSNRTEASRWAQVHGLLPGEAQRVVVA